MYKPKPVPPDKINSSTTNPMVEVIKGVLILALIVVLALGFISLLSPVLVKLTPVSFEKKIGRYVFSSYLKKASKSKALNSEVSDLVKKLELDEVEYISEVLVSTEPIENAFALPGGVILITEKLLRNAKSENEKLFVLAHEVGHHHYRHSIKALYSNLIWAFIGTLVGADSSALDLGSKFVLLSYSRDQERDADLFALELMAETQTNLKGSFDFFSRKAKGEKNFLSLDFYSSHPDSKERVEYLLKKCIKDYGESFCS